MKFIKTLAPLLLVIFFACKTKKDKDAVVCLPNNLEDGIIAYYTFGNGSLADKSIFGHNLSNPTNAQPTPDRDGSANCAYQFNNDSSDSEFLTFLNPAFLNSMNSFSISLWYQPLQSARLGSDYEVLVSRGQGMQCPDRRGEWSLGLYDGRKAVFGHNNSVWANLVPDSVWGAQGNIFEASAIWHHLVCIKDNETYQLYFDAILQGSKTGSANCGPTAQDAGELFIGKDYTGKIDDIIIYNRGLSQQEIMALYNQEPCCQ